MTGFPVATVLLQLGCEILAGGFRVCGRDQGFPVALDLRGCSFSWGAEALAEGEV